MDVREIFSPELEAMGAGREILSLWTEIAAVYEQSGPEGVKALLTEKVKALKKSAAREAKEKYMTAADLAANKNTYGRGP